MAHTVDSYKRQSDNGPNIIQESLDHLNCTSTQFCCKINLFSFNNNTYKLITDISLGTKYEL